MAKMDISLLCQLLINGLMSGGIYALIASGFTLILGVMQIFNLAHGDFYMLGAYLTFGVVAGLGLPYPMAVLTALIAVGVLGILFYVGIIRWTMSQGFFHSLLITVFLSKIITQTSLLTFGFRETALSPVIPATLNIGQVKISGGKLLLIGCAIAVMVSLYYFMKKKIGTAISATAENKDIAALQGINTQKIFLVAMAIGCGLSGIAGGLAVPVLSASVNMGIGAFTRALLVVLMGGMGSMLGALIAAFIIGVVESFAFHFMGSLNLVIVFVVVAILIYFKPGGLLGKPLLLPGE
jgi:branched-chain amino acid transport system permease protein